MMTLLNRGLPGVLVVGCWLMLMGHAASAQPAPSPADAPADAAAARRAAEVGHPFVQSYAPSDYGSHQQTWAVAQDTSGLLYVGTSNGLVVYDGARWRQLPMDPETTGARERIVRGLARGPGGRVYAGLIGGLGYFAPDSLGQLRFVSLLDEVPADQRGFNSIWSVTATEAGVFFLTDERLFRWSEGRMTSWSASDFGGGNRFFLTFAVRGQLYVHLQGQGLMRLETAGAGEAVLRRVPGGQAFQGMGVYTVLPHGRDGLLVGSVEGARGARLEVLGADGALRPFSEAATGFLQDAGLYCGLRLPGARYAFGTHRGGVLVTGPEGEIETVYDRADGVRGDKVHALRRDGQGGLWLALGDGISRVAWRAPLTHFAEQDGLAGSTQEVMRHRGRLYAATNQALYRLRRPAAPRTEARFERVAGGETMILDLASGGRALLAGTNRGVLAVRGDEAETAFAPAGGTAFALHRSRADSNRVYVGLVDGLAVLEKDAQAPWTEAQATRAELDGTVRTMTQDSAGTLWLGTSGSGILRLPDGPAATLQERLRRAVRFDTTGGLPALPDLFLYERNGRAAAATSAGLYRHDPASGRFVPDTSLGARFAEAGRAVYPPVAGAEGTVWIYAGKEGAARPEARIGEALYHLWPDDAGGYRTETPLARLSGPAIPASGLYPEPDGSLWLGSNDGLYRYWPGAPPRADRPEENRPPALIRRVAALGSDSLLFGGYGSLRAAPTMDYDDGALRFSYAAARFDAPSETRYRVRLDGLDDAWSHWTTETRKDYTNLSDGDYTFRVQAEDAHGNLSREASFGFSVLPPWYRTWWAYLALALLAVTAMAALVRARSVQLKARTRRLEQTVEARTAEVREQRRQLEAANQELSNANDALRTASEQKTELLGIAAHDLNAPLMSIKGFAEILLEDCPPGHAQREPLEVIREAAENVLQRVADLRTSASLGGSDAPLEAEQVDLEQLAQWILKRFRVQAGNKEQPLRFDAAGASFVVSGDPIELREAMSNLISNAIKYSPVGGLIDVRLRRVDGTVRFAVEDRGPGLTEADREVLFQPFRRLSATPTGGEPSSGLGLYIVEKFVKRHGGRVGVESAEGEGSTFYFVLPAAEEVEPQNGQNGQSGRLEVHA